MTGDQLTSPAGYSPPTICVFNPKRWQPILCDRLSNCLEGEIVNMNTILLKLHIRLQNLATREEGQDLVEYTMMVALMSFAWVAGMQSAAQGVNKAFLNISTTLSGYVT